MKRIMIVEDETAIREFEAINLKRVGYTVVEAGSGEEALEIYDSDAEGFDIALLDISMPGMDGFTLCKELRKRSETLGIIMLTARTQEMDKISGLMLGADDYIVKPFAMDELMARMEMVLRRAGKGGHQLQAFDVTLDSAAHLVLQRGQPVELTPREFALLETLMRNRGAAVYRDTLMERAWGGDAECTRAVDTYITRLRKKLDWSDKIETVYQIGYRLKLE